MKKEFLMLSDLADRWQCSKEYLHELIRQGNLTPSVRLTDQERYVGGEFVGGMCIGDVDGAVHKSYIEFYVNSDSEAPDSYENWPQCAPVVFCHCPEIESEGRYLFQFVSESLWPGKNEKWFYLNGYEITSEDADLRFRFELEEVERVEASAGAGQTEGRGAEAGLDDGPSTDDLPVRKITTQGRRSYPLSAEINYARKLAGDSDDPHSVWASLVKLADDEHECLLAFVDGKIKYMDGGKTEFYTFEKLSARLRQTKRRNKQIRK